MSNNELADSFYPREYRTTVGPLACPSHCDFCGEPACEDNPIRIERSGDSYLHDDCRNKAKLNTSMTDDDLSVWLAEITYGFPKGGIIAKGERLHIHAVKDDGIMVIPNSHPDYVQRIRWEHFKLIPIQEKRKVVRTIDCTPDYENLLRNFAHQLSQHSFAYGSLHPIISTIEMVRYIDRTNPDELEAILNELRKAAK